MILALAGNPNCGKTTLFNALTGSNQHVGNFPGVTVDRKDGTIRNHPEATVTDLPGIYSLSPYTSEEIVSRQFVLDEKPDAIIEKIVMGGIAKYFKEICLLQQPFVKDDKVSVEDHIAAVAKQIGASIKLVGYTRFEKGEGIEKRQDDLAEEVAKLVK